MVDSRDKDALAFIHSMKTLLPSLIKVIYMPPLYKIFRTKLYDDMTGAINAFGMKYAEELMASNAKNK